MGVGLILKNLKKPPTCSTPLLRKIYLQKSSEVQSNGIQTPSPNFSPGIQPYTSPEELPQEPTPCQAHGQRLQLGFAEVGLVQPQLVHLESCKPATAAGKSQPRPFSNAPEKAIVQLLLKYILICI